MSWFPELWSGPVFTEWFYELNTNNKKSLICGIVPMYSGFHVYYTLVAPCLQQYSQYTEWGDYQSGSLPSYVRDNSFTLYHKKNRAITVKAKKWPDSVSYIHFPSGPKSIFQTDSGIVMQCCFSHSRYFLNMKSFKFWLMWPTFCYTKEDWFLTFEMYSCFPLEMF